MNGPFSSCDSEGGQPDGLSGPLPPSPAPPPPAAKRRRLRGKQPDVVNAFSQDCNGAVSSQAPHPAKRPRHGEREEISVSSSRCSEGGLDECSRLVGRAQALHDECSVDAVWEAASLRAAAGDAAYEAFATRIGIVTGSATDHVHPQCVAVGLGGSLQSAANGAAAAASSLPAPGVARECPPAPPADAGRVSEESAPDPPSHAARVVAAFCLPPEDEMMNGELHCPGEPCEHDDDEFNFGYDLGPSAYHS